MTNVLSLMAYGEMAALERRVVELQADVRRLDAAPVSPAGPVPEPGMQMTTPMMPRIARRLVVPAGRDRPLGPEAA